MFDELIINAMPELCKFFKKLRMGFYFTKPQIRHFQAFIVAMMLRGFAGKMNDVAELSLNAHRTCIGRFLNSDSWNEGYLHNAINAHVINVVWEKAKQTKQPIYVIIDDTICEKAVPSSKVKQSIDGCGFHRSHLKNKTVYGHQFVCCVLRCGDLVLPFDIVLYDKEKSKIEIAEEIIKSLPKPLHSGYVVTDSWYSCKALFKAAAAKGYHFVGALKSNRLIFPRGFRKEGIQIGVYARSLKQSDFDLVTVKGHHYYSYTYLGKINGLRKVKIVITWPEGSFGVPQAMKAFISTDIKMNAKQLLSHYTKRWVVEVFFRESNCYFGMKQCQVRSKKAVIRYQYILMLGYIFCGFSLNGDTLTLGSHRYALQRAIEKFRISWLYEQAQKNVALVDILRVFKVA